MKSMMQAFDPARYTMVAPSMRGYAPTDIPENGDYYLIDLARDTLGLIEELGFESSLLVGHDWGAPAAYTAANLDPESVDAVVGMAVPPLRVLVKNFLRFPAQFKRSWYMFFFQLPEIPEIMLRRNNFRLIDKFYCRWSPALDDTEELTNPIKESFKDPDRLRAALDYYRCLFQGGIETPEKFWKTLWASWRKLTVPGLVLSGEEDGCIAPELFEGTESAFHQDGVHDTISNAGHFMHLERPDKLADRIRKFLSATK
jgi:pimeloyl-ACP methyl ester carboxylesterase